MSVNILVPILYRTTFSVSALTRTWWLASPTFATQGAALAVLRDAVDMEPLLHRSFLQEPMVRTGAASTSSYLTHVYPYRIAHASDGPEGLMQQHHLSAVALGRLRNSLCLQLARCSGCWQPKGAVHRTSPSAGSAALTRAWWLASPTFATQGAALAVLRDAVDLELLVAAMISEIMSGCKETD